MAIELLWIVPVVAIGLGFLLIALFLQKKDEQTSSVPEAGGGTRERPVRGERETSDNRRISDIERQIERLRQELSNQEEKVERFEQENTVYCAEINDLRSKLQGIHKEYDIVVSENFSLRARVKKLKKQLDEHPAAVASGAGVRTESAGREIFSGGDEESNLVAMRLFGDTRRMEIVDLEDTGEIDITRLR